MSEIIKIEQNDGNLHVNPDGNMISKANFVRETDEEDGAYLMVVDTENDRIDRYCVAFNGRWVDLS